MTLREYCEDAVGLLKYSGSSFGYIYVQRTMELYHRFVNHHPTQKFGLFSSVHGPDFFSVIIECLDGREWKTTYTDEHGKVHVMEFEKNFADFIKFYRNAA